MIIQYKIVRKIGELSARLVNCRRLAKATLSS